MNTFRRNVLVVDDDEGVRLSYLRSLDSVRCDVEVAADGNEALRAMERNAFDLVMLDVRMPGADGMTVLKTIREKWPESEVVIITGYPSIESAKEAIRLGANDYIAKPVGPDEIVTAASRAMQHKEWTLRRGAPEPSQSSYCDNVERGGRNRCAA